jgi:predicted nucleic acid-binding protein
MTPFVFLDTNILFRYVTQGQTGCEPQHWEALKSAIVSGLVKLLLPEVVELEFGKLCQTLKNDLEAQIQKVDSKVAEAMKAAIGELFAPAKGEKIWNEVGDMEQWLKDENNQISARIKAWHEDKLKKSQERIDEVVSLFDGPSVERLALDTEIVLRTTKRLLAGKFKPIVNPQKGHHKDRLDLTADCHIIDTLVRRFERSDATTQLLFCCENKEDFAMIIDGKLYLHSHFQSDLKSETAFFVNLQEVANYIKSPTDILQPTAEAVREAVVQEVVEQEKQSKPLATKAELNDWTATLQKYLGSEIDRDVRLIVAEIAIDLNGLSNDLVENKVSGRAETISGLNHILELFDTLLTNASDRCGIVAYVDFNAIQYQLQKIRNKLRGAVRRRRLI